METLKDPPMAPQVDIAADGFQSHSSDASVLPEHHGMSPNDGQLRRSGRQRPSEVVSREQVVLDELMRPLTEQQRQNWTGWVELESDPALFNFILREYGVKDIKIQEVLSLDDEMLTFLPQPTYGLIFLFKYRDSDAVEDAQLDECPDHVWFANQTTTNACATVALLNIVMNIPLLDLGDQLGDFKNATHSLKPASRGYEMSHNNFIRTIHNSFARKMDMRNADLTLSNEAQNWFKARTKRSKRNIATNGKSKKSADENEPGFHFIAYVPIEKEIWRLDGLQERPINLGTYHHPPQIRNLSLTGKGPTSGDWIAVARENIYGRIEQYDEDGLQFNLLALCASPLKTIPVKLSENAHSILALEARLDKVKSDWRAFLDGNELPAINKPDMAYGLSKELLEKVRTPDAALSAIEDQGTDPIRLSELYRHWMSIQSKLRANYMEEVASIGHENEQAARRKVDHTPCIYSSVRALAESGLLKGIVEDVQGADAWSR
ncbi:hypothetical protein BP5796_07302 [Coleophoma crateriformis]|uniref:Ubiquitin carboxyl-terminal hydrolase n=1 Tax=Coleophoma crateriformis TaxID=565419 RepID=A0A3D8RIR0_9HELO|nr:hypothetical protein BP5796_07302 [Coleophoma crateriformis]